MLMISRFRLASVAVLLSLLAGCATQHHRAPVEDQGRSVGASVAAEPVLLPPGAGKTLAKPGYFTPWPKAIPDPHSA